MLLQYNNGQVTIEEKLHRRNNPLIFQERVQVADFWAHWDWFLKLIHKLSSWDSWRWDMSLSNRGHWHHYTKHWIFWRIADQVRYWLRLEGIDFCLSCYTYNMEYVYPPPPPPHPPKNQPKCVISTTTTSNRNTVTYRRLFPKQCNLYLTHHLTQQKEKIYICLFIHRKWNTREHEICLCSLCS